MANQQQEKIEHELEAIRAKLRAHLDEQRRLAVVQAPPGSGKTHLLLHAVAHARSRNQRVAVATQTNAQADDVCARIARDFPKLATVRLHGREYNYEPPKHGKVSGVSSLGDVPHGPTVCVATSAKWAVCKDITEPFDVLVVEEAWQLSWADFMLLGKVAGQFVFIGDPGQIPPVVTIDPARWQTSPRPPHMAAPQVVLRDKKLIRLELQLPATRRLPHDTVDLVRPFYDFEFAAYAQPGDRALKLTSGKSKTGIDKALESFSKHSAVALTLPTLESGPPLERDTELATMAVNVVTRALERAATYDFDDKRNVPLKPEDIGLCATHRVMVSAMDLALPTELRGRVRVDTPERWQGLERKLMIMVHPLSSVVHPSSFDIETGRLCVMASRHQVGLVTVTRDHLGETLDAFVPSADQAVGLRDVNGRGHDQHLAFWGALVKRRVVFEAA